MDYGGTYYDFYDAANDGVKQTGLAASSDLLNWTGHAGDPSFAVRRAATTRASGRTPEPSATGTTGRCSTPESAGGGAHIMGAFLRDDLNWTVDLEPLYRTGGNPSGLDRSYAHRISLVHSQTNATFHLFHCAAGDRGREIGLIVGKPL